MSKQIIIDLTENLANAGKILPFAGEFKLPADITPYPNAVLDKVSVSFDVVFDNPDVIVKGVIVCFITGYCDRCLKRLNIAIELPFDQIFYKDDAEDDDCYTYSNSILDVTSAVTDEIILSLPTSLLCNDDCKGLCPKCGCNRNEVQCNCDTTRENPFSALKNLKF